MLVTAACAEALDEMEGVGKPDALSAFRRIGPQLGSLGWARLRIIVVAVLLSLTTVGIPFAVVYLVSKVVVTQACVIEQRSATSSLRRSSAIVDKRIVRVLVIAACINVTAFLLGPIVGVLVLFLTSSSLAVINIISSLVYAVVMPYVGITLTLLFYDLRARTARAATVACASSPRCAAYRLCVERAEYVAMSATTPRATRIQPAPDTPWSEPQAST